MASERKLTVVLAGDAKSLTRTIDHVDRKTSGLGSKFDGIGGKLAGLGSKFVAFGKVAALGLGAAAVGIAVLGKGFVDAAIESQKITKQTEAVLTSMGDQAGVTAGQVADLSEKLSMQSGVDDELIQSGQNVLLTFGKVQNKIGKGNKIFDRATEAALNMSVALGTDLQGANIQIGKALNDPIKGITALARAGVSFTDQQKDQIRWMTKAGDSLGAQKVILGELENQFGGSAAAQATAGDKLKVVWGNLQEQLGERLIPIFEKVAGWLGDTLPVAFDTLGRMAGPIGDAIRGPLQTVRDYIEERLLPTVKGLVSDGFQAIKTWWDNNGASITGFFTTLGTALGDLAEPIGEWIWETALPAIQTGGQWLIDNEVALAAVLGALAGGMTAYGVTAFIAAAGTWAAVAPLLPFIAVGAAAAAVYYALANRGDGFLDVVIRTALALYVIGAGIVNFFKMLWHWATMAWEAAGDLIGRIGKIIELAKELPSKIIPGGGINPLDWAKDKVPFLDEGGVMPGLRGVHYPAMVAGGETVLPTHKPGFQLAGGGGGNTYNFYGSEHEPWVQSVVREIRRDGLLAG